MKINKLYNCIYFMSFILILSCSNTNLEKYDEIRNRTVSEYNLIPTEYKKDSMFLHSTVRQYIENGYEEYQYVFRFGKKNRNKVKIHIDDMYYSPDRLKLLVFVVLEIPVYLEENKNSLENPNLSHYFNGHLLQAFRNNTDTVWDVYSSGVFGCHNYESIKKVRYNYREFFFDDIKGPVYGCNLNESCFWTDTNVMWRKGDVIPGFYNFQINTNKYYYERDKDLKPLSDFLVPRLEGTEAQSSNMRSDSESRLEGGKPKAIPH